MAYLVPPNVILKYFQNFWSCCEAPVLPILHFLVSNESLEHYLNAILQKFCSRAYQFLKTKSNVSKFMILLSKISDLPPKCNLKYFRKFWSCWWTIMSFTIIVKNGQSRRKTTKISSKMKIFFYLTWEIYCHVFFGLITFSICQ